MKKYKKQTGSVTPALLIITASFITAIFGLLLILALQLDYSHRQVASEKALHIAEAGINYYKWHLAHDPEDFQDGTGSPGPYVHEYKDPQGESIGYYSLEIEPPNEGSSLITIRSTGWSNQYNTVRRTIKAEYGMQSLAEYSFLGNASVWYGEGVMVNGRVHSNNGIRMDGINTSIISSAQEIYKCGWETGCEPPDWKPGVWGSGGDQALWRFPVTLIDFDTISFDIASLQQDAQNNGLYLDDNNVSGYHIVFSDDGTFDIYEITRTDWLRGYSVPGQGLGATGQGGCRKEYQLIDRESLLDTYNVEDIPIIFSENELWVEGVLDGRVTIVAANFPLGSSYVNIWIPNNLTYADLDGTNALALIAQNDIYFTRDVPNYFQVDAVLMAQKGKIIRHGYFDWCGGTYNAVRQKLSINGSLISYFKSYWNFGPGPESGFIEREINYDAGLIFEPPPYFPTSGEYQFISWTEE